MKAILFHREEYDSLVRYTAAHRGQAFLGLIKEPLGPDVLSRILGGLGSFIREATLIRESRSDSEQVVLDYYLDTGGTVAQWFGYDVDYVKNVLPRRLLEGQLEGLGLLRADIEKARADSFSEADALEKRVKGHQEQLQKLESQFNFVGLTHAFRHLLTAKIWERRRSLTLATLLGGVAFAVPAWVFFKWDGALLADAIASSWSPVAVSRLLAALGAELVVLYYFRIALRAYLLVQNQVTNLQLRIALCSFIEGYLDFASKAANAKSGAAISGFESLIFGSLPTSDEKLPATLEGIEHIAKIAESLKRP